MGLFVPSDHSSFKFKERSGQMVPSYNGRPHPFLRASFTVIFRIEQDETKKREPFAEYAYRIYDDNRLVAHYWHDQRGDEHEIEFIGRKIADWPFVRMTDFIEGGGSEPLRLTSKAIVYLQTVLGPK